MTLRRVLSLATGVFERPLAGTTRDKVVSKSHDHWFITTASHRLESEPSRRAWA